MGKLIGFLFQYIPKPTGCIGQLVWAARVLVGGYGREAPEKIAQREIRKFFIGPDFRFSAIPSPKKHLRNFLFHFRRYSFASTDS
jgi:hypothetical protein